MTPTTSDYEKRLLKLIPYAPRFISTVDLAAKMYKENPPWNARQIIVARIKYLRDKLPESGVTVTGRAGPHPMRVSRTR